MKTNVKTKREVHLAPLRALKPSFETSHFQTDDSTATLIVVKKAQNKTVKSSKKKQKNNHVNA